MSEPEKLSDVKMDMANLYREEAYTDLKTGGIRRLVPVKLDGSEDTSRKPIFSGHTQLMSPHGPLPLQGAILKLPLRIASSSSSFDIFPPLRIVRFSSSIRLPRNCL